MPWHAAIHQLRELSGRQLLNAGVLESQRLLHVVQHAVEDFALSKHGPVGKAGCEIQAWARCRRRSGKQKVLYGTGIPHLHVAIWASELDSAASKACLRDAGNMPTTALDLAAERQGGARDVHVFLGPICSAYLRHQGWQAVRGAARVYTCQR